jgi:hypothetical protein
LSPPCRMFVPLLIICMGRVMMVGINYEERIWVVNQRLRIKREAEGLGLRRIYVDFSYQ